jgi:hypothetical protein
LREVLRFREELLLREEALFDLRLPDDFLELLDFFRELDPFFFGTLAPACRASLRPIAIACFRLVTLRPEPERSVPCLRSCITFSTFF